MKTLKALMIALVLFTAAGPATAESSRCYCQPQGNFYVLWYIDHDGLKHVIYTYDKYAECMQGLYNTFLCNR